MNHSTLTGRGAHCDARCHTLSFFAKAFTAILFFVFIIQFDGNAQGVRPSCNISGPLEAVALGAEIIINVEVAHSTATPNLTYTFTSNSSGAFIRTKGPVIYTAKTNSVTQQLTISPGQTGSEFNLKLTATTAGGVSECSKSVSVSR